MPDRTDITQTLNSNGEGYPAFEGNTTSSDTQAQTTPDLDVASGDELARYSGGTIPRDVFDGNPSDYTQYANEHTETGDYRPVTISGPVTPMGVQVAGWCFVDTTNGATAFVVRLRDGNDASAPVIANINLTNGTVWLLPAGIRTRFGLYAEIVSGTVTGTIYTRSLRAN